MDYDSYFGLSTSSSSSSSSTRNYQSTLKSILDMCIDYEEIEEGEEEEEEEDEELSGEYFCPICSEDFDFVGLCCHIDEEHPVEAKSGVCPVCAVRVGMNMVEHITTQHGNISKSWHKLKLHKEDSHLPTSSLRKELQYGHFQSLLSRSSSSVSSSKMEPDPFLSFIYNAPTPTADVSESVKPDSIPGEKTEEKSSDEKTLETNVHLSSLTEKDHAEKEKRCKFVQGLILSTFLDDDL